jgi:acyl carrier protein
MNDAAIFSEMLKILGNYTKDPSLLPQATLETNIIKDLKVNSARLVDVIIKCEDAFGITIEDEEADKIVTVGDAVGIIRSKLAA